MASLPLNMTAVVKTGSDKVGLATIAVPKPGPGEVLVRVYAAAQNPSECTPFRLLLDFVLNI